MTRKASILFVSLIYAARSGRATDIPRRIRGNVEVRGEASRGEVDGAAADDRRQLETETSVSDLSGSLSFEDEFGLHDNIAGYHRQLETEMSVPDLSMSLSLDEADPIDEADSLDTGPRSLFPLPFPQTRFTDWDRLSDDQRTIAEGLGYSSFSWNNLELADIEYGMYDTLTAFERAGINALGMDKDMWNCWINHYASLFWDDLEQAGLAQYYVTLGWTQDKYDNNSGSPNTEGLYWYELTDEQKHAAAQLCYSPISWDWIPLDML